MKQVFVRPARPDLVIRMPDRPGQVLPQEGADVTISAADPYWQRRINDGDVVIAKAPAKAAAKKEG